MTPITDLTLEDFFASMAMQGDWAAQNLDGTGIFQTDTSEETLMLCATQYYRMSRAMMKARKEHD